MTDINVREIKVLIIGKRLLKNLQWRHMEVLHQRYIILSTMTLRSFYTLPISSDNRNKTKKTVISKIIPSDVKIGDVPALLLQINAFNTNLYDGYFEGSERIQFTRDNKIGSESNFVLFYPRINGLSPGHYTCYFLMLAYEDPTKDSGEVSKLAKIVAKQILNVPVQNIKISMILDELKSIGDIPELRIKYYSLTESDNNVDVKYASYLTKTSLKREEIRNFKNMPFTTMESLISDSTEDGNYQKLPRRSSMQ